MRLYRGETNSRCDRVPYLKACATDILKIESYSWRGPRLGECRHLSAIDGGGGFEIIVLLNNRLMEKSPRDSTITII